MSLEDGAEHIEDRHGPRPESLHLKFYKLTLPLKSDDVAEVSERKRIVKLFGEVAYAHEKGRFKQILGETEGMLELSEVDRERRSLMFLLLKKPQHCLIPIRNTEM